MYPFSSEGAVRNGGRVGGTGGLVKARNVATAGARAGVGADVGAGRGAPG